MRILIFVSFPNKEFVKLSLNVTHNNFLTTNQHNNNKPEHNHFLTQPL